MVETGQSPAHTDPGHEKIRLPNQSALKKRMLFLESNLWPSILVKTNPCLIEAMQKSGKLRSSYRIWRVKTKKAEYDYELDESYHWQDPLTSGYQEEPLLNSGNWIEKVQAFQDLDEHRSVIIILQVGGHSNDIMAKS